MKKLTTLLVLALITDFAHAAQHYYFNHYSTADGLPSNTIFCSAQDQYGFMWIGTRDGISRFDGKNFTTMARELDCPEMGGVVHQLHVDKEGLVWFSTTKGSGSYNPSTGDVTILNCSGRVFDHLASDANGNIWMTSTRILSDRSEIFKFDKKSSILTRYPYENSFSPNSVAVDNYGGVWITSIDGGLYLYDVRSDQFNLEIEGKYNHIIPLGDGRILVTDDKQDIYTINPNRASTKELLCTSSEHGSSTVLCLIERAPGEIWIGTETGIFIYNDRSGSIVDKIEESRSDSHAISASYVTDMAVDMEGNVWAGTFYKGMNLWINKKEAYAFYYSNPSANSIKGEIIRTIRGDNNGNIWIASEDGYLSMLDPRTKLVTNHDLNIGQLNFQDVMVVDDKLYLGTYGDGLIVYDPANRKIVRRYTLPGKSENRVIRQIIMTDGTLMVGTRNGLYKYDNVSDSFSLMKETEGCFIHALAVDSRGNLWIGTYGNGLIIMDKSLHVIGKYTIKTENSGLRSDSITSFCEDSKNQMWVTTEGGGISVAHVGRDLSSLSFKSYDAQDGLPSNVTCAIAEDKDGILWITTTNGLSQMDPETETFSESSWKVSPITGNQYSYGATYTAQNGTIYFGTTEGMISFNTPVIKAEETRHPIFISRIYAIKNGVEKNLTTPGHSAMTSDRIDVKHKDVSNLIINFSRPNYSNMMDPKYEYCLKKGHMENHSISGWGGVAFTNLEPGTYHFTVSAVGDKSAEGSKELEIRIIPPFHKSIAAYLLYILFTLGIAALVYTYFNKMRKVSQARHLRELFQIKQNEVYNTKINFFTNLTHEIRTPLTLIKMPLDKIIKSKQYAPEAEKDMLTIQANAERLLTLTNELLDIQKLENNESTPAFTRNDICKTIQSVCSRYESIIKDRNINFELNIPEEPVEMMYAKESLEKILANLLTNAVKYGNNRIKVSLEQTDSSVALRVDSNGERINDSDREKIFEKFYHGGQGTGLGLPLARALAELHKGRLYLDDQVKDVNSFVLEIPKEHPEQIEVKKVIAHEHKPDNNAEQEYDSSRHTILIVEDNLEFRDYLASELCSSYNIKKAANGRDALDLLQENKIDIVISDIMMPVMDGVELCNQIKTSVEYSHVPVILLTAAVGMETRIETLQVGADGYIEKPFPIDLLKANIANLFKNREIAFHQFANSPLTHYNSVTASKVDEDFMTSLHNAVMTHMAEQDLSIETLTSMMNTSKSTLYRKVKANTGLNVNEYIRLCRLKQAAEMLSSQKYKINEVGYMVGFTSPSYFTSCFQKQFNISPSAFVKNLKE